MKFLYILFVTLGVWVTSSISIEYTGIAYSEDPYIIRLSQKSLRYMKHLYEDIQNGKTALPSSANTVRSVIPRKEVDNQGDSYTYNVLGDEGSLVVAKIQIQNRRSSKRPTQVVLELVNTISNPQIIFMHSNISNVNVTEIVQDAANSGTMIRVRRKQLHKGKWKTVKFRNPPTILIYTQDSRSFSLEDFDSQVKELSTRAKRSINEINNNEISPMKAQSPSTNKSQVFNLDDFNPIAEEETKEKKEPKNKYKRRRKFSKKSKKRKNRNQLIPFPENYKKKTNKQQKTQKRGKFLPNHFIKTSLNKISNDVMMFPTTNSFGPDCEKKDLFVDFKELDWNHFIISPQGFHPNYCSGSCPNPLSRGMAASNHAIIKSVMQQIGQWPGTSQTHCVPDKLSSLSLLLNTSRGIILRNYPGMEIETCSCR